MSGWQFEGHGHINKVTPNKVGGEEGKLLIHMSVKFTVPPKTLADITGAHEAAVRAAFWAADGSPLIWCVDEVKLKSCEFNNLGGEILDRKFNKVKANKFRFVPMSGGEATLVANITVDGEEHADFLHDIAWHEGDTIAMCLYQKQAELEGV